MEQLEKALAHFQTLLEEQFKRLETLNKPKKDFTTMQTVTIGVCPGDGIGPMITAQAVRVLEHLLKDELAAGKIIIKHIEGLTIENRLALNQPVPDDVLAEIKACDVLLKGPTTTPNGGTMTSANVTLRRELDLYANVRPVFIPEQGIDWMFYREYRGRVCAGQQGY